MSSFPKLSHPGLTLNSKIGSGSYGTVYDAKYHGQSVVVKVQNIFVPESVNVRIEKGFDFEAQALNRLYANNSGATVEYVKGNTKLSLIPKPKTPGYIIMPKEAGENPLACLESIISFDKLSNMSPVLIQHYFNFLYGMCQNLIYFNKLHYVHADIKPDNMLYDKVTKKLKIIDHGAGYFPEEGPDNIIRRTTSWYASPELFLREKIFLGAPSHQKVPVHSFSSDILAGALSLYHVLFADLYIANLVKEVQAVFIDVGNNTALSASEKLKAIFLGIKPKYKAVYKAVKKALFPSDDTEELRFYIKKMYSASESERLTPEELIDLREMLKLYMNSKKWFVPEYPEFEIPVKDPSPVSVVDIPNAGAGAIVLPPSNPALSALCVAAFPDEPEERSSKKQRTVSPTCD